jgi:hypothetical protein
VDGGGAFTLEGGTVTGNTASSGGGVWVDNGEFMIEGGTISGNTASSGGGVSVGYDGAFTMQDGAISGNTADHGGGVYVDGGAFIKRGRSAVDASNSATGGKTAYVYIDISTAKQRNSEAGPNVNMDSRISGRAGGWE